MKLIIELDSIEDTSKKQFILQALKFLGISFHAMDSHQSMEEYNKELEESDAEIDEGKFISMYELLKQMDQW